MKAVVFSDGGGGLTYFYGRFCSSVRLGSGVKCKNCFDHFYQFNHRGDSIFSPEVHVRGKAWVGHRKLPHQFQHQMKVELQIETQKLMKHLPKEGIITMGLTPSECSLPTSNPESPCLRRCSSRSWLIELERPCTGETNSRTVEDFTEIGKACIELFLTQTFLAIRLNRCLHKIWHG